MKPDAREWEWFAVFVHGVLAALHAISAVWNWRYGRRVDRDVVAHTVAGTYDLFAARKHWKRLRTMKGA